MPVFRVLVADDERLMAEMLEEMLRADGMLVEKAYTGKEALEKFRSLDFDLVLLDLRMPEMNGLDVLQEIKKEDPAVPVIVITAYGSVDNAVEALKFGAYDFITKPFKLEELRNAVARALEVEQLRREKEYLLSEIQEEFHFEGVIGESPKMKEVMRVAQLVAKTDATVLICGESGTGKELLARSIHYQSNRRDKPFVVVNCGAITETLLESELFGHEKGAFTGAYTRKPGKFELADGGTIFLDEIGEMSPAMQVKLLRVLQEKTFERVGGTTPITVDVRIIAATNRDLKKAVREGTFREDLYYRLNVIPIYLPPLRERKEDLPLLCDFLIARHCRKLHKKIRGISPQAMRILRKYHWPGNIRELDNVLERAIILTQDDVIGVDDLQIFEAPKPERWKTLKEVEEEYIAQVLEAFAFDLEKAAAVLDMPLEELKAKAARLSLTSPEGSPTGTR
ncbi:sigma-54-dependent transcriptional regulator [Candidatus Caldatribacterium sp. SIUC1]|uniref:sigma-54-dependent transcriptional regulator n=1 Tax=Candidatus Caldatribacterium sp. SIUC1 TaxID=3418365 RepID=UPI003F692EB9